VRSRRLTDGSRAVLLHVNDHTIVEEPGTGLEVQASSFKLSNLPLGPLVDDGDEGLVWQPKVALALAVGDELILADATWFGKLPTSGHEVNLTRPSLDSKAAPTDTCTPSSYSSDPDSHQWCCRPHTVAEGEWADTLAERRARGELNPQAWPPLVDEERFDVGDPDLVEPADTTPPDALTPDDLD
jgi:hypothetical protein